MRTVFIMLVASSLFACGGSVEKRQTSEPVAAPPALGVEEQALTSADPGASADMLALARDCDGGNVTACTDLGKRYRAGDGVPKDADRGIALFERSCERDVYEACGRLAGALTPRDPERARTLATKACNAGNAIGCFNLGYLHSHGLGGPQDYAAAAQLYEQACTAQVPQGCTNLAELWELGQGRKADAAKAADFYGRACAFNPTDHYGCASLSMFLASGKGIKKDQARALELATNACAADEPIGCRQLGLFQRDGVGLKKDLPAAVASFDKACTGGDGRACMALGDAHRKGVGTTKDVGLARKAYGAACNDAKIEEACKALKALP